MSDTVSKTPHYMPVPFAAIWIRQVQFHCFDFAFQRSGLRKSAITLLVSFLQWRNECLIVAEYIVIPEVQSIILELIKLPR